MKWDPMNVQYPLFQCRAPPRVHLLEDVIQHIWERLIDEVNRHHHNPTGTWMERITLEKRYSVYARESIGRECMSAYLTSKHRVSFSVFLSHRDQEYWRQ
ncbi:hypothetical protein KP509_19G057800 [Ceratopteris richardii]|uniref:Uncharacterized protein n=1 Tax=Ceratopteris richardii TaxID=49495 RepID=A0A8T2SP78_CERRI|nr:hypothetical protein KP509_19G057800 [Ceratopteris richardii]